MTFIPGTLLICTVEHQVIVFSRSGRVLMPKIPAGTTGVAVALDDPDVVLEGGPDAWRNDSCLVRVDLELPKPVICWQDKWQSKDDTAPNSD